MVLALALLQEAYWCEHFIYWCCCYVKAEDAVKWFKFR